MPDGARQTASGPAAARLRLRLGVEPDIISGEPASDDLVQKRFDGVITEEEAKAIARRVGKPTLEFAASIVAPLYWAQREDDGTVSARTARPSFCARLTRYSG
jgi:hypothetical protein